MAAGARLAVEAGHEVRGSDNPLYPPASEMVEALGVPVARKYDEANLDWGPEAVVIGNALSRGNPEVEAVLDRRIPYLSLPEWLKLNILRTRRPVVVCGTHGKTTTASLLAHLLDHAGMTPGFLIGGQPLGFPHSSRLGAEGGLFVIEGDEYDTAFFDKRAKFFHYLPEIALVTGIEFDHGDIYPDLEAIRLAFRRMLRQVPRSGRLVLCADDVEATALREHAFSPVTSYGFHGDAAWRAETVTEGEQSTLTVYRKNGKWGEFRTGLAGKHNQQNALAAIAVAGELGASPSALASALESFPGVRRRMEVFLEARGAVFVDDFAHHPTAIRGVVLAARERWPERRLWAVFEPRSNTTVTNRFQSSLIEALCRADQAILGPIYRADAIPAADRLDRDRVVAALGQRGVSAAAVPSADTIADTLHREVQPGDVILIMSNGAFGGLYNLIRERFCG